MTSQKSLFETNSKLEEVERRVKKYHFEDNSCLRVIAEKIVTWKYFELSDEFRALKFTISVLKEDGVAWSRGQIRRALKYCYDPRYYTREEMREVYEMAEIECENLPQVPTEWEGITEWCYPEDGEDSENWHARRIRISSDELSEDERVYWRSRDT